MKKNYVYAGALVVIVGLTVYFGVRNLDTRRQLPNNPESARTYICEQCGHVVSLTPRQFDEMIAEMERNAASVPQAPFMERKTTILMCPVCKQRSLLAAQPCPICQNPYAPITTDGVRHDRCKSCEAAAETERTKE
ncbi:MAG TPA: hypothetical protein VGM03_07375 [Phycisphaerae bacterium]